MENTARSSRDGLYAALLACAAFLPVLFGLGFADRTIAVDVAASLTALAAIVAAVALVLRPGKGRFGLTAGLGVAFLLVATVSAALSGRGWSAFMGEASGLAGLGMLLALTLVTVGAGALGERVEDVLARYAWVALLAESAMALLQKVSGAQGSGTLPNSSYLGIVCVVLLPWVLPARPSDGEMLVNLRITTVIVTLAGLAATGSRVALVVCLAWAAWVFLRASSKSMAAKAALVAGAVVVLAVLSFALAKGDFSAGFGDRPGMWKMAAYAVKAKPILGWGPDGYMDGAAAISTPELGRSVALQVLQPGNTDPHNAVAWLAVSTGVLGLVVAVALMAAVAMRWEQARRAGKPVAPAVWAVCGVAACGLLAPIPAQVAPLCALALGVSLRHAWQTGSDQPALAVPLKVVYASVAVLVVLFGFDAAVRAGIEMPSPDRSPALAVKAQDASQMLSFDPYVSYLAAMHWGYAAAGNPALNDPARDTALARRAMQMDSRNPFYALVPVRLLVSGGAPFAQVQTAFIDSFSRYPVNPFARAPYAAMLAQQGRVDEAKEQLRIAEMATDEGNQERLTLIQSAEAAIQQAESNSAPK